jgi:acyl-CoA dehydrogenase
VLSYLYLASATLKRFEDQGRPRDDLAFVQWGLEDALYTIQCRLDEILVNFPSRALGRALRVLVFPLGRRFRPASDRTGARVARLLMEPGEARERLVEGCHRTESRDDASGRVEYAFRRMVELEPVQRRIDKAIRSSELTVDWDQDPLDAAREAGVVNEQEYEALKDADAARRAVIMVDDFDHSELARSSDQPAALSEAKEGHG